jgi:hypothetical protein
MGGGILNTGIGAPQGGREACSDSRGGVTQNAVVVDEEIDGEGAGGGV